MNKMVYGWVSVIASLFVFVGWFGLPWVLYPVLLFTAFLASGGKSFPKVFFKTILRDIRAAMVVYRHLEIPARLHHRNKTTIPDLFQATVARHPHKVAFLFEGKTWTFQEVEDYSNRIANYFRSCGYQKGDVIALYMESSPEFVCMWLGLAKIGVISALINFSLRLDSLLHCMKACKAKGLVFGTELCDAVRDVKPSLPNNITCYCIGRVQSSVLLPGPQLDVLLQGSSVSPPTADGSKSFQDHLFYMFTSGTTGLPKAVIIRHSRFFFSAKSVIAVHGISAVDVIYCALPLYHAAGGILGVGACFITGASLVIKRKFSASRFWHDCVEHKVTVIQYIGELCRYVLAQPVSSSESQHTVRLAVGNGLRQNIWREFQSRFQIKQIGELYGATEGNAGLLNTDNTVGAVGFLSQIIPKSSLNRLVQVQPETGELVRGSDGLAVECSPGQPGTLVALITRTGLRRYDGYLNQQDTSRKIARNVLSHGDSVFLSGDVLTRDEYGYVYFQDRTGDTFRWHGENVSTTEVESIISKILGLRDVAVYGVLIPGTEGRAGMAAIGSPEGEVDLGYLAEQLNKSLPSYARPVFVRLVEKIDMTGTLKLQKVKLRDEGFDINQNKHIFIFDSQLGQYSPLDRVKYDKIMKEQMRI